LKFLRKNSLEAYLFSTIHNDNEHLIDRMIKIAGDNQVQIGFNIIQPSEKTTDLGFSPIEFKDITEKLLNLYKKKTSYPLFHTDACQATGALPINVNKLGVDLMTINGSKIYGPKGVGCLYVKKGIKIEPQIIGGSQEFNKRAGTENISLFMGMAEALKLIVSRQKKENQRLLKLRDYLIDKIKKDIKKTYLNGHPTNRLPNNVNFSFYGIEGESLVLLLDDAKIYCSTGSACSSLDLSPSHVLLAIGLNLELAHGSLRMTLGRDTKKDDLDAVAYQLKKAVDVLRKISTIK